MIFLLLNGTMGSLRLLPVRRGGFGEPLELICSEPPEAMDSSISTSDMIFAYIEPSCILFEVTNMNNRIIDVCPLHVNFESSDRNVTTMYFDGSDAAINDTTTRRMIEMFIRSNTPTSVPVFLNAEITIIPSTYIIHVLAGINF